MTMTNATPPSNATPDIVLGFGSDATNGWAVLASDGKAHPCAAPTILHWLQVAAAHTTPVEIVIEPDPFGTISYVSLRFTSKST
ncbi:MAG TPA: hypothetical protein VGQ76_14700 [Thermoanaerobaculia bacterium]|jgi:hypothetical protein|nr:hypothetical protein [Thermoanaerobaculia bacterium]